MRSAFLVVAFALALTPACADAQPPDAQPPIPCEGPSTEEAMRIFQAGLAAGQAERWSAAFEYFEQSYRMSCAPAALHNRGMALMEMRRFLEARDNFAQLLAQDLSPEIEAEVSAAHADATARLGVLAIAADEGQLSLDGEALGRVDGARLIEVDPGPHVLELEGGEPWRGEVAEGARVEVTLRLPAAVATEPSASVVTSPDLLAPALVLGAGALVALAGIAPGVVALEGGQTLAATCPGGACPESARALADEVLALSIAADVLFAAGVSVGVVGLVWLIVELGSSGRADVAELSCAGAACEAARW